MLIKAETEAEAKFRHSPMLSSLAVKVWQRLRSIARKQCRIAGNSRECLLRLMKLTRNRFSRYDQRAKATNERILSHVSLMEHAV